MLALGTGFSMTVLLQMLLLQASVILLFQLPSAKPSRLLLLPFPFKSHVFEMSSVGKELAASGHDIYIVLPGSYPDLDRIKAQSGFTVIQYSVKQRDFYTMPLEDHDWVTVALNSDPVTEFRSNVDGFIQFCTNPLEDATLADRLRQLQFDLAVVDAFPGSRCYWILANWIDVPYLSITTQFEPWLWRVPSLPSFVPFPLAAGDTITERMNFLERVWNTWSLVDWTVWPRVEYVDNSFVENYLPGQTYWSLAAKSLLWLIDTDTAVDYPRPMMPNEVNIGGLSTRDAQALSGQLKEFVDSADNGVIVVAFGSLDVASERFFEQFFTAFSLLSEYHVVWRYDGKIPPSYSKDKRAWPKQVFVQDWLPLNDLLGHVKTKLFLFHCGANSQFEALYHAVPQLCLTVWGDQPYNAARMHYRGYGVNLGSMRDVTTDKVVTGIRDVINNRSYADAVRAAAAIFRSRPQNPSQRAAWWIDHVIQHGGSHLHSYSLDIAWYEYLMLDILVVCVLCPLVLMTSAVTACICCCWSRRRGTIHQKQQ